MLFFGHIGLTLLLIFIFAMALKVAVDYRLVIVGSMLPDIIDKPVGEYLFSGIFHNGRIFSHTLLFIAVLAVIALLVAKKSRYWGIGVLAAGALFHQAEDQMWNSAGTWLWPLFGWEFPKYQVENYILYLLSNLLSKPEVYLPELIGIVIVSAFVVRFRLYRPENARAFVLTGMFMLPQIKQRPLLRTR